MAESKLEMFFKTICEEMEDSFNSVSKEIESPIEELMCAALLSESTLQINMVVFQGKNDGVSFGGEGSDMIKIFPQYKIGQYRVDFYLEYIDRFTSQTKKLIIECDGHDFHEKTKEQAQKDKSIDRMLLKHSPVMRFTGSEIHKDAHDCAYQAIDYLTTNYGLQ
jgi:very-short-patch-repair endonuclease